MRGKQKILTVAFYRTENGREPVREWLLSLDDEDRKIVGDDLKTLEYGWPIGMPLCRPITSQQGLWEVRSDLKDRIARVFFCIAHRKLVLLHGFIKKTQKIPNHELRIAIKRMKGGHNAG